jgi:hypothetical protein
MSEMIEHYLRRQPPQQVGMRGDVGAIGIELHVPAELVHAARQWLDHVPGDDGVGAAEGEADAANTAIGEGLELGIRDGRTHDRDTTRARAKLLECIEGDVVVGRVIARRYHYDPCRAGALLQQPIIRDRGILRVLARPRIGFRKARVVDVHVAIGGIGRGRSPCRICAGRVGYGLLGAAGSIEDACRGRGGGCRQERAACDVISHCFLPARLFPGSPDGASLPSASQNH